MDLPPDKAIRKQITVLFCDVVDYTSRSISMDPEDLSDDMRVFQTICTKISHKYHGHISNYLGDGMLVLFGHPVVREFDPEHAIHAGLEMVKEIKRKNNSIEWKNKMPLSIRVGIATGLVVVGERAGEKRNQDELIFGEAPNLAARLQAIANPGSVLCSLRTRRLTGGIFDFKDLGEFELKGFNQKVPAWQVLQELPVKRRRTILGRDTTQFVSREQELSFLNNCYETAVMGRPISVHLTGVAGMGKTRLMHYFSNTLENPSIYKIHIIFSPYSEGTPIKPLVDELNRWMLFLPSDSDEQKRDKIKLVLATQKLNDNEHLVLVCELLSVNLPEETSHLDLSSEEKFLRTLELGARFIYRLSKSRPIMIFAEDLHWADPSSLVFFTTLFKNAGNNPIFTILSSRPSFKSPWKQSDSFMRLPLSNFDQSESYTLIKSIFSNVELPKAIAQELIEKGDGNPLYLEECSWNILTQIKQQQNNTDNTKTFSVPDTLQDSLNARLDSLGNARELAQLAAVFSNDFSYLKLRRLASLNGIETDKNMDILIQSELLDVTQNQGEDLYNFKHALFQEAAYQSLLIKIRQHYHQQVAELYLQEDPSLAQKQPEFFAFHYTKSNNIHTAIQYWLNAGRLAIQKSTTAEARKHLQQGLNLLPLLTDPLHAKKFELDIRLSLAACQTISTGYFGEKVLANYKKSIKLAKELNDQEQQWSAMYGYWRGLTCQAEYMQALKVSVALKGLSERLQDRKLIMISYGISGISRMIAGKFNLAESYYNKSVTLYDHTADKNIGIRFGQDPFVTVQGLGAVNTLIRAKVKQSFSEIDKSLTVARYINHPYTVAETLRIAAVHAQIAQKNKALRKFALETIEISEKFNFEGLLSAGKIFLGYDDAVSYGDVSATQRIQEDLLRYKEKYALLFYLYFQGLLAQAYLSLKKYQNAFTTASHVLMLSQRQGEVWIQVPMIQVKVKSAFLGELADADEINQWYQRGLEIGTEQHADLFLKRLKEGCSEYSATARSDSMISAKDG